jgi:hypothetical protein
VGEGVFGVHHAHWEHPGVLLCFFEILEHDSFGMLRKLGTHLDRDGIRWLVLRRWLLHHNLSLLFKLETSFSFAAQDFLGHEVSNP